MRTKLTPEDSALLTEYYKNGKSERELAAELNVAQQTINNRRRTILAKLLKMLE